MINTPRNGYPDYTNARCAAITKAGKRCTGRWQTALNVTFGWDPLTGEGVDGPHCVLCHRHSWWAWDQEGTSGGARFRVAHGWLGAANKYGNGHRVYASKTGNKFATWWWARRRVTKFGQSGRRDAA